jgi:alpha-galactosidase
MIKRLSACGALCIVLAHFAAIARAHSVDVAGAAQASPAPSVAVEFRHDPRPAVRYTSGNLVYEEQLYDGRYRVKYWSPDGIIKPDIHFEAAAGNPSPVDDPNQNSEPIANSFAVTVDGQDLWHDWQVVSMAEAACPRPHCKHVIVELRNQLRPTLVRVHTQLDGSPFIERWLEIVNKDAATISLGNVSPFSGMLFAPREYAQHRPPTAKAPFTILKPGMEGVHEGDFRWIDLHNGEFSYEGKLYGTPFSLIRSNITAENFVIHFAWTGSYRFTFDTVDSPSGSAASLYFRATLGGPSPQRLLRAGETVTTPHIHVGHMFGDLDQAIQATHSYVRSSVLKQSPLARMNLVEVNSWGYVADVYSESYLKGAIDVAAATGAEVFTIDAGWSGAVNDSPMDWWNRAGDWRTLSRLPHGLRPICDYAHAKGLKCGLWFDIERAGPASEVVKQHPDWLAKIPGASEVSVLDVTNPEVAAYIEDTIARAVHDYGIDLFRLDYNTTSLGYNGPEQVVAGAAENTYWRHYDAVYGMYARIRKRFPALIMENCAGGGGRNDLGMLANFDYAQQSDEWSAVKALKVTNGFTLAFPPEYGVSWAGVVVATTSMWGDLDFQYRRLLFSRMGMSTTAPTLRELTPELLGRIRHHVDLYKRFVRPMLSSERIFHHTPISPSTEPGDWIVLEAASPDASKDYAGVFRLPDAEGDIYRLRARGLDASKNYKVTLDNTGESFNMPGAKLKFEGIPIRVSSMYHSELVLFEAVH